MNADLMFSSKSDLWSTPQDLFDELNAEFGFTLDTCALPENAKCAQYYTPEINGLIQKWEGVCWCNPPYGHQISKWVEKAAKSNASVVMLLPARTDTKWFHKYIYNSAEIRFIEGRLKFSDAKNSAPFPSMIVIFRRRYIIMNYIERMENELKELQERAEKLDKFIYQGSVKLDGTQKSLMIDQLHFMRLYEATLKQRISYERWMNL